MYLFELTVKFIIRYFNFAAAKITWSHLYHDFQIAIITNESKKWQRNHFSNFEFLQIHFFTETVDSRKYPFFEKILFLKISMFWKYPFLKIATFPNMTYTKNIWPIWYGIFETISFTYFCSIGHREWWIGIVIVFGLSGSIERFNKF